MKLAADPAKHARSAASSSSAAGTPAIDVARECAQLGARSVTMVYRRGAEDDERRTTHELDAARKEGVASC